MAVGEEQIRSLFRLLDQLRRVREVLSQVIVVDLVHDLRINVCQLDISVHTMLAKKGYHWLEFQQHAFLVDLEIGLWFPEVVKFRNNVVTSARDHLELKFLHFRTNFFQSLTIRYLRIFALHKHLVESFEVL